MATIIRDHDLLPKPLTVGDKVFLILTTSIEKIGEKLHPRFEIVLLDSIISVLRNYQDCAVVVQERDRIVTVHSVEKIIQAMDDTNAATSKGDVP